MARGDKGDVGRYSGLRTRRDSYKRSRVDLEESLGDGLGQISSAASGSAWVLVDLDQVSNEVVGMRIEARRGRLRIEQVRYASVGEALVDTGGCHVRRDGAVVALRVEGRWLGPEGETLAKWRLGT
jgi:hypothetical protein